MQRLAGILAFICLLSCTPIAYAGPYTDELSKCLIKSTPSDDQIVLMQWVFSAMSLHPAVSALSSVTAEQRVEFDKKAAGLFVRLMTADCRQQTIDALKYEGALAIQASFQLFGQAAMRGLMSNAQVAEGLRTMAAYIAHDDNWISVLRQGGISAPLPGK